MKTLKRIVLSTLLAGAVLFMTAASMPDQEYTTYSSMNISSLVSDTTDPTPEPKDAVVPDGHGGSEVNNPGLLAVFGPATTLIGALCAGVLLIVRAVNEGRGLDVKGAEARAEAAEEKSAAEITKIQAKLESMERKLDEVIADREVERTEHQTELASLNARLIVELRHRYFLEELLAKNGISISGPTTA